MESGKNPQDLEKTLQWLSDTETPMKSKIRKFIENVKRNPFVPLGMISTVCVLICGLKNMNVDARKSQLLMRWRVGLQAFTIAALIGGSYIQQGMKKKEDL